MSAPGTYGPEHAVGAIAFVRRKRPFVEGREIVFQVVKRTATHVTYRTIEPDAPEITLPVRAFDEDFEAEGGAL